jgi:hypothetical protein
MGPTDWCSINSPRVMLKVFHDFCRQFFSDCINVGGSDAYKQRLEIRSNLVLGIFYKGAPASECRMLTRLVSPAIGREKKKWNPLVLDKIIVSYPCVVVIYKAILRENHPIIKIDITTTSGAFEPYNPHGSRDERVVPLMIVYHPSHLSSARWCPLLLNSKHARTETSIPPVITLRKRKDTARVELELKYQFFFMLVSVLILMNGSCCHRGHFTWSR